MKVFSGTSVLPGVAIGPLQVVETAGQAVEKKTVVDPGAEVERYEEAKAHAMEELKGLYELAVGKAGEENAAIFDIHQMLLDDSDFNEAVISTIMDQKVNAEYAVKTQGKAFADSFTALDDGYMSARATDMIDVSDRVVQCLQGNITQQDPGWEGVAIILADELTPSQTIQMDKSKVLSFVTRRGSASSHSSILAHALNLPSLVGVDLNGDLRQYDCRMAVVDGFQGKLILEPDAETLASYRRRQEEYRRDTASLKELIGKENVTPDGRKIRIFANIGSVQDADLALANDAGGIGLFRSEFLYLGRDNFPTEEQQFESYRAVAEKMQDKLVIIRTLDIGADKQADYFHLDREENPALGYRAIRICLTQREIFETQLRALLRASAYGNIGIMFPMIASVWEVRQAREILEQVRKGLQAEGTTCGTPKVGIMIETPAAALISDRLSREADFFSIGTNDLTQYTLAADRQNQKLAPFVDTHHEAILRLIRMTAENARKAGIPVGICGELAADESLTGTFLDIGIDELSVAPGSILKLRRAIRNGAGRKQK